MLPSGFAFLDGNDEEEDYHLHIIASEADRDGYVIVLSVSSMYRFADRTTLLKASDHPWLKHDSYIAYNFAKVQKAAMIESRLARLPRMIQQPCSDALLKRVQAGILESEQSENGVKNFYREIYF